MGTFEKAAKFETVMGPIGHLKPDQRDAVAKALAAGSNVEGAAGSIKARSNDKAKSTRCLENTLQIQPTNLGERASGVPDASQDASSPVANRSLAVVMTSHNRKDVTLQCLDSVVAAHAKHTPSISLHIYIVDDGSRDDTGPAISRRYPQATVIQGSGDLYWSRGMYTAFGRAIADGHDFYLWLNDDVQLFEDALDNLLASYAAYCQTHAAEAVIVGTLLDPETHQITYGGHNRSGSKWLRRNQRVHSELRAAHCESFSGNCVLLPRSVVQSVGNVDPVFHHGYGDHDYGYRCSALNIPIIVCQHFAGYCQESDGSIRLYDDIEGRNYLIELGLIDRIKLTLHPKHYPPRAWFVFARRYLGPLWPLRFMLPYLKSISPRLF